MKYEKPEDLPYTYNNEIDDLWTIFSKCPLERGSVKVYSAFAQARETAFNDYKNAIYNKHNSGMDL